MIDIAKLKTIAINTNSRKSRIAKQAKEHAKAIIQPFLPDGTMNGEFVKEYPKETSKMVEAGSISQKDVIKSKVYKS